MWDGWLGRINRNVLIKSFVLGKQEPSWMHGRRTSMMLYVIYIFITFDYHGFGDILSCVWLEHQNVLMIMDKPHVFIKCFVEYVGFRQKTSSIWNGFWGEIVMIWEVKHQIVDIYLVFIQHYVECGGIYTIKLLSSWKMSANESISCSVFTPYWKGQFIEVSKFKRSTEKCWFIYSFQKSMI